MTGPEGQICAVEMLGDHLWIKPDEIGGPADSSGVYYYDVPLVDREP